MFEVVRKCVGVVTVWFLLIYIREVYTNPAVPHVENQKTCLMGQKRRSLIGSTTICCFTAKCTQLFKPCDEDQGFDECVPCGEDKCSRIKPYNTTFFTHPPTSVCQDNEIVCDGVGGAEPVRDDGGCVVDCRCKPGFYNFDKNGRECQEAKDPCHRKGQELSEKGVCVDCPTDKYKNFFKGQCIKKTVCGPGEVMEDAGTTTTDAVCKLVKQNPDGTDANNNPEGDVSRKSESTTVHYEGSTSQNASGVSKDFPGQHKSSNIDLVIIIMLVVAVVLVLLLGVILFFGCKERRQRLIGWIVTFFTCNKDQHINNNSLDSLERLKDLNSRSEDNRHASENQMQDEQTCLMADENGILSDSLDPPDEAIAKLANHDGASSSNVLENGHVINKEEKEDTSGELVSEPQSRSSVEVCQLETNNDTVPVSEPQSRSSVEVCHLGTNNDTVEDLDETSQYEEVLDGSDGSCFENIKSKSSADKVPRDSDNLPSSSNHMNISGHEKQIIVQATVNFNVNLNNPVTQSPQHSDNIVTRSEPSVTVSMPRPHGGIGESLNNAEPADNPLRTRGMDNEASGINADLPETPSRISEEASVSPTHIPPVGIVSPVKQRPQRNSTDVEIHQPLQSDTRGPVMVLNDGTSLPAQRSSDPMPQPQLPENYLPSSSGLNVSSILSHTTQIDSDVISELRGNDRELDLPSAPQLCMSSDITTGDLHDEAQDDSAERTFTKQID